MFMTMKNLLATINNEDIIRALLILTLRDIITNDTTLTMNRVLLHIKNNYDISLKKNTILILLKTLNRLY